jgi:hypothetical protein
VTFADAVAENLAGIESARVTTGQYAAMNPDGTVMVDFGQGLVQVYSAGFYTPLPGEYVRCLVAGVTLMLGPVKPRPAYGKVTGTGSPRLDVQLADGTVVSLPRLSSYLEPAVNDQVTILWANGGIVLGDQDDTPTSTYVPPSTSDNGAAPRQRTLYFASTDSGSQNGSGDSGSGNWWTNDVWCGASTIGAWFYGNQIDNSIPDDAQIDQVQVYVQEFQNSFPGSLATIGTHTLGSKSGNVTVTGASEIPRGTGWRTVPNSYGDLLKTGAAKGLATNHGGLHKFRSRRSSAQSGRIRITFTV